MDGEMLVCDVDLFQRSYLPFIPADGDITACVEELKKSNLILQEEGKPLQWTEFQGAPSGISKSEKDVLIGVANIAQELASYSLQYPEQGRGCSKARVEYLNCPETYIASEIPGANFKNDGCFVLNRDSHLFSPSKTLAYPNIAVVAEYKKGIENELDNHLKVVSAASHIMNDDPRRTFIFGITTEGTMVSLWYFSRSHSAKSKPFDFMRESKLLISIFLSFLFSDETGLGYDPAIRRCPGNPVYYEYQVGNRYYRTRGSLSNFRSLSITDRATRVWRAVEIIKFKGARIPGKEEVALKDVWLDEGARTESEIQNAIFEAIKREKDLHNEGRQSRIDVFSRWPALLKRIEADLENDKFRRYFMSIDCDHQGQVTKPIPTGVGPTTGLLTKQGEVQSRSFRMKGADPSRGPDSIVRPSSSTSARLAQTSASAGATSTPATTPPSAPTANAAPDDTESPSRAHQPKRRYFLVFSDVGQALDDVSTLRVLFGALRDVIFALVFLFVGNWVHRDISTGNIIALVNGGTVYGKLSDLEYAKEFGSTTGSPDTKTGTPFFMAFELLSKSPLSQWQNRPVNLENDTDGLLAQFVGRLQPPVFEENNSSDTSTRTKTIVYTFQHDLESLLWIILWTLLARVAHSPGQIYVHQVYVNRLENTPERHRIVLVRDHLFFMLRTKLHGGLSGFAFVIAQFGSTFWNASIEREDRDQVREPSSYGEIYITVMEFWAECMGLTTRQGVPQLISLHPQHVRKSTKSAAIDGTEASKRPHPDDDMDSETKRPCLAERRLDLGHLST